MSLMWRNERVLQHLSMTHGAFLRSLRLLVENKDYVADTIYLENKSFSNTRLQPWNKRRF